MIKTLLLVFVGVVIGYFTGFSDAQRHADNLAVRVVNQIGGSNRGRVSTDVDKQMENVEKP